MTTDLLTSPDTNKTNDAETSRLADFLADHFPEDAVAVNLSESDSVVELTLELLKRLWRSER